MFKQQYSVCSIQFIPQQTENHLTQKPNEPNFSQVFFKDIRSFQDKAQDYIKNADQENKLNIIEVLSNSRDELTSFAKYRQLNKKIYFFLGETNLLYISNLESKILQLKEISKIFNREQIKLTLIGDQFMKNLRENEIKDLFKQQANIDFLIHLKKLFSKKNIQFLTSEEALQISHLVKPKQIMQRPKYNGTFQIRNELTADVVVFTKTLEKHIQNLKTYSNVSEWNSCISKQQVEQKVEYYLIDDCLLQTPIQEISKGYRYGDRLVKMSELFLNQINLFTLKEIKLIGSVQKQSIPRQSFMQGCDILFAKQDSKISKQIIASLAQACLEENRYLIARFVLRQNSIPKLVALIPQIKRPCEYFYITELPTIESIRDYSFNSLQQSTKEQQKLMSQLIDELDLDSTNEDQNIFKIGQQPNETIAKINDLIYKRLFRLKIFFILNKNQIQIYLIEINSFNQFYLDFNKRGLNMAEEEICKIFQSKDYITKFKTPNQKLLSNISQEFNLKIINQEFYHDNVNQKVFWKNLLKQNRESKNKIVGGMKEAVFGIQCFRDHNQIQKTYQNIDFSMPANQIISILCQPIFDQKEYQEYFEMVQNIIFKMMETFIKGQTSQIIIELILLMRNKSIQFEQYETFNQFLAKFSDKFQHDQFVKQIVCEEIKFIQTDDKQNSVILTQIEEEFIRQNILQREKQSTQSIKNLAQDKINKDYIQLSNKKKKENNQNNEEIYYSDESEKSQIQREQLDQIINEGDQLENNLIINKQDQDKNQNLKKKKINKLLDSFTKLSSYDSIYSDSESPENEQEEDAQGINNQLLDSSLEEEEEEEQKQSFFENKRQFYKKLLNSDDNFKLCYDNKILKETLIEIDLTYKKPQVKNIAEDASPLKIFEKMWSNEIWQLITDETNKYSKQCFEQGKLNLHHQDKTKYKLCYFSQSQIKRFIICEILMGIQRLPSFSDYFSSDPLLSGGLNRILGREDYQLLTRYLHISDNSSRMVLVDDQTKFKSFQSILNRNYQQCYTPSNYLAIDEGIIPFKGKTKFKVYCPQKPVKFGIKEYLFCDYSGFTLNQIINSPHEKQISKDIYLPQTLQTQNIVYNLIQDYQPLSGSILIMDNYYNSLNLIHQLNQQNIGVLGTVRPDRMNFTDEQKKMMKIKNFNKGETKSLTKDNIHILLWRDKDKLVKMITNFLDNRKIVKSMKKTGQIKTIPLMIDSLFTFWSIFVKSIFVLTNKVDIYNKYAHSVDKRNQICQNYRILKRSQKWWKCVFYRLLDTTICNAYIIYKILNEGKKSLLSHKDFRIKIVEELIQNLNEQTIQIPQNLLNSKSTIYSLIDINKVRKQNVQQEIIAHFLEKQKEARFCSLCKQTTYFVCESCNFGNKKIALCPVNCHKQHVKKVYNLV